MGIEGNLSIDQVRMFRPMLGFLNGKDRDILYLIFVSGKRQCEVREILRRSQPSLCYDIKRIRRRLRFVYYLNSVSDIFIEFLSNPSPAFTSFELEVLTLMFYTSSFTLSSDVLKQSQVKIRYAYDKALRKMEAMKMWEIYEIFLVIRANLNIIRRIYKGEKVKIDQREMLVSP
jgi:hypothetical protein